MSDFSAIKNNISKRIKELRLNAGLSTEDVSNEVNMSFPNYFYLEKGTKFDPQLKTLYRLAQFYNVPLSYFFQDVAQSKISAEKQKLCREFDKLSRDNKNFYLNLLSAHNKAQNKKRRK